MHPDSQPVSEFIELRAPVRRLNPALQSSAHAQIELCQGVSLARDLVQTTA